MNKPRAKPVEIVLATWPLRSGPEYLGDRMYPGVSGCESFWLSLRAADDDDSFAAWKAREPVRNIGLWVWMSTESDNINVEFRLHEVHSATTEEVEMMLALLKRLNKKVPARLHGQSYHSYVMDTLKAVGIKRCVEYRGVGVKDEFVSLNKARQAIGDYINRLIGRKAA